MIDDEDFGRNGTIYAAFPFFFYRYDLMVLVRGTYYEIVDFTVLRRRLVLLLLLLSNKHNDKRPPPT